MHSRSATAFRLNTDRYRLDVVVEYLKALEKVGIIERQK